MSGRERSSRGNRRAAAYITRVLTHHEVISMGKLANKVAIVTGASKGIGAGIARHLAGEGASVVVNYASDKAGAERVVAEIRQAGGRAVAAQGNVAKPADVDRLLTETESAFGRIDILVNNAGVYQGAPI